MSVALLNSVRSELRGRPDNCTPGAAPAPVPSPRNPACKLTGATGGQGTEGGANRRQAVTGREGEWALVRGEGALAGREGAVTGWEVVASAVAAAMVVAGGRGGGDVSGVGLLLVARPAGVRQRGEGGDGGECAQDKGGMMRPVGRH